MKLSLIAFVFVFWFSTPLLAQDLVEAELRQGYYTGVGASAGLSSADDDDLGSLGSGLEVLGRLRLGQMFSPRWGAGFVLFGGTSANEAFNGVGGGVGLELTVYPLQSVDLSLRPSVGLWVNVYSRIEEELETSDDPSSLYAARIASTVAYDVWCGSSPGESGGRCLTLGVDVALAESDGVTAASVVGLIEFQQFWGLAAERLF